MLEKVGISVNFHMTPLANRLKEVDIFYPGHGATKGTVSRSSALKCFDF